MRNTIWLAGAALALVFSLPAQADSSQIERTEQAYIYGWKWQAQPESMVRVPRGLASQSSSWLTEDQPLRVQKVLPSYRHMRSGAQIHWEIQQEISSSSSSQ